MATSTPRVPTLMQAGMWLATFMGGLLWLTVLGAAAGCSRVAINGEHVSAADFLSTFGLASAILGSLLLGAAYGIWTERSWSRHVVIAFWCYLLLVLEMLATGPGRVPTMLSILPLLGGSAVYFYGADQVVAYFRALQAREQREAERSRTTGRGRP
jgi:hypothetical protein